MDIFIKWKRIKTYWYKKQCQRIKLMILKLGIIKKKYTKYRYETLSAKIRKNCLQQIYKSVKSWCLCVWSGFPKWWIECERPYKSKAGLID